MTALLISVKISLKVPIYCINETLLILKGKPLHCIPYMMFTFEKFQILIHSFHTFLSLNEKLLSCEYIYQIYFEKHLLFSVRIDTSDFIQSHIKLADFRPLQTLKVVLHSTSFSQIYIEGSLFHGLDLKSWLLQATNWVVKQNLDPNSNQN